MKIRISTSAKQLGTLYHYTTKQALLKILRSGKLSLSTGRGMMVENKHQSGKNFFASFTRSRFGGYHYGEEGHTSLYEDGKIMLTLDGDALSNKEKIVPIDYWEKRGSLEHTLNRNKEYEERLVSNRPDIPILKYIKRIDIVQRGVMGEIETYGMDKGKFKLRPNDHHERLLGSIILQLKKHKIPFAFYDNMDDWAKKRGEFTYTGPKKVSVDSPAGYASQRSYQSMQALVECLSELPYEKISKRAQEISGQLSRYPNDVDSVFNDYENFRKPDANPAMRDLALKIARVMQRRGFNDKREAGKFIAAKAELHYKIQQKRDQDERNIVTAPLLVDALTKPIAEWPEVNFWYAPRAMFLNIADRWSYTYDEAVRTVSRVLETEDPEIDKLRRVMKEMKLEDASDVVASIYYDKVKPLNESKQNG